MNTVGSQTLKQIRESEGLTQAQFAEKLGLSDKTVSAYERGAQPPSPEYLQRVSEVFRVPAKQIAVPGSISTYVLTPEQLREVKGRHADAGVRGDFEAVLQFVLDRLDALTLKSHINAAVDQGRSGVARVLLDFMDRRYAAAHQPAGSFKLETSVSSKQDVEDAVASVAAAESLAGGQTGSSPKREAASPSGSRPEPSADVSEESTKLPVVPKPVPK